MPEYLMRSPARAYPAYSAFSRTYYIGSNKGKKMVETETKPESKEEEEQNKEE